MSVSVFLSEACLCTLQSRELLQSLLQLEPDNTRALGMLGTLEWKAGNRVLARKHLMAGIQANPKHVANLHSLARLELEEGHLEEARKLFAKGQKLEPNNAYILQVAVVHTLAPAFCVSSPLACLSLLLPTASYPALSLRR